MKKYLSYGFAASVIAGIAVVGATTTSHARSVPAFIGQPQVPTDYSCFINSNGIVTNKCSTTKQFCIALPVDDSSHSLVISVIAPNVSHNVVCFGQAGFRDNSIAGFTGGLSPSTFGGSAVLTFPTLSVPGQGNLFACCNLSTGSSVESINY
jgi:hypothetical protein